MPNALLGFTETPARLLSAQMTMPEQRIRRATVEDLPRLLPLWEKEGLPVAQLQQRFKEFQVSEEAGGEISSAIGLQVSGLEGRLHSEAFGRPEEADALREKYWERVKTVAANHGLVRVWTQNAAPGWQALGFQPAPQDVLAKLPPEFAGDARPWLFTQLREETAPVTSIDREFAMFREAEKERTDRLFRHAKVLKLLALLIGIAVLCLVVVWAISFFRLQSQIH